MNQQVKSEKTCRVCGVMKSLSDFNRQTKAKDGHSSLCKVCDSERSRAYYKANADAVKAYQSAYRKANPDIVKERKDLYYAQNSTEILAKQKAYKQANRDKIITYRSEKKYPKDNEKRRLEYKANPEPHKNRQKAYAKANPELMRNRKRLYVSKNKDKVFKTNKSWREAHAEELKEKHRRNSRRYVDTIDPVYVAVMLRMRRAEISDDLIALKQEQILIRRLARQLKKASNESSKDTDRIPGKHGASGNARGSSENRREQPIGTGAQGDQCNRRRSTCEGAGLDQQQSERRDKGSKDEC